jgi:hypothetical protein
LPENFPFQPSECPVTDSRKILFQAKLAAIVAPQATVILIVSPQERLNRDTIHLRGKRGHFYNFERKVLKFFPITGANDVVLRVSDMV